MRVCDAQHLEMREIPEVLTDGDGVARPFDDNDAHILGDLTHRHSAEATCKNESPQNMSELLKMEVFLLLQFDLILPNTIVG